MSAPSFAPLWPRRRRAVDEPNSRTSGPPHPVLGADGPPRPRRHKNQTRRVWVRETWGLRRHFDFTDWCRDSIAGASELPEEWELDYRADWGPTQESCFWRPSIRMPRWASRATLDLTPVRVERLQAITQADARAEGVVDATGAWEAVGEPLTDTDLAGPRGAYRALWESIHGPGSWPENPWVWVLGFKRVSLAPLSPVRSRSRPRLARGAPVSDDDLRRARRPRRRHRPGGLRAVEGGAGERPYLRVGPRQPRREPEPAPPSHWLTSPRR